MDQIAERAHLLYDSKRYDLAMREFLRILEQDPAQSDAHAFVALCRMHLGQLAKASDAAKTAVETDPDNAFAWYVSAFIAHRRRQLDLAEKSIAQALELQPQSATYRGLSAILCQQRGRWEEALRIAEAGLQIDPEEENCALARSRSLVRLGRLPEARGSLEALLARDPENPLSQAHLGWTALEQGDRRAALVAFREALRMDPELEWAREGLVEALRAGVPFYSFLLQYYLKMGGLNEEERWALIVGEAYFARIVTIIGCSTVILFPLALVYLTIRSVFLYMTWAARPVTGLFLRLHPFGRYCLNDDERREAAWAFPGVAGMIASLVLAVVQWKVAWLVAFFVSIYAVSSVGATYHVRPGWPRWLVAWAALMLLSLGGLSVFRLWLDPWSWMGWLALLLFVWARHLVTLLATVVGIFTDEEKEG